MKSRHPNPVEMCLDLRARKRRPAGPMLVLLLAAGCSPALDKRPAATDGIERQKKPAPGPLKFPNENLAAKHKAAKESPQSFDAVFTYARALTEYCLVSLADTKCAGCADGAVKRKPPSELDTQSWSLIEEAGQMLDALLKGKDLTEAQTEQVVIQKGRLEWLAGNPADEEALLDGYLQEHPDSLVVLKRRLKLLREAGNATGAVTACARSRASMKAAPEAPHLDLLTTCVSLHPDNKDGSTNPAEYAQYLPDLSKPEERLYRKHLVQRCVESLADPKAACKKACACEDTPGDRQETKACKRTCRECQKDQKDKVRKCKKFGGFPPAEAPPESTAPAGQPKKAHDKNDRSGEPKEVDPASEPQKTVL